jgi:hypothetical protein
MDGLLRRLADPSTNLGTARWVALGLAAYDACARGMGPWNLSALLALCGLEALRYLPQGPSGPGAAALCAA